MTTHHCGTCFRAVQPPDRCAAHPDAELLDPSVPHEQAALRMLRQLRQSRTHRLYRALLLPLLFFSPIATFYALFPVWFGAVLGAFSGAALLALMPRRAAEVQEPGGLLGASAEAPERDSAARAQRARNQAMRGRRQGSGRFMDGITNQ